MSYQLLLGDCTQLLATISPASVDAVITDPPYPEIARDYGRMTEAAWWNMMMDVCAETRRILKPSGSAVFILQPNSRKVGSMRGWLWKFMWWVTEEWNMVQDVWWWNYTTIPGVHVHEDIGLLRPSLKVCIWAGSDCCYRNQSGVMWREADSSRANVLRGRALQYTPSTYSRRQERMAESAAKRNGTTPFNVIPLANTSGSNGHGAGTPLELAKWWTRYIVPPGGTVCDPFMGSGTMGLAALAYGNDFIGIEKEDRPGYFPTASARLADAAQQPQLTLEKEIA